MENYLLLKCVLLKGIFFLLLPEEPHLLCASLALTACSAEEGADTNSIPPKNTVFPLYFWKCALCNRWLFLFNYLKGERLRIELLFLMDIRIGAGPSSSSELDSTAQCLDRSMLSVSWSPGGNVNQASFIRILSPYHYRFICQRTMQTRAPREEAESLKHPLRPRSDSCPLLFPAAREPRHDDITEERGCRWQEALATETVWLTYGTLAKCVGQARFTWKKNKNKNQTVTTKTHRLFSL